MKTNAWNNYSEKDIIKLNEVADAYKIFISNSKTERESTNNILALAERRGLRI